MGRKECCSNSKVGLNRGTWTAQEDSILTSYINAHGEGQWRTLPERAGLKRCGKRLRWLNYLKPDIKRGNITPDEDNLILRLHRLLGNRWSLIAGRLPGRTDNEIKNHWNTKLAKKAYNTPSPQVTYKCPANTTTKVLKPVPFKATRPVNCPEFPLINSNPTFLRENFDLYHNEVNPVNFDNFDMGLCDFENNVSSIEALLMDECINNVNNGREYEHNLDMEGLDMFVNAEKRL